MNLSVKLILSGKQGMKGFVLGMIAGITLTLFVPLCLRPAYRAGNSIVIPIDHRKAIEIATENKSVKNFIANNFSPEEGLRKSAELKWNDEQERYIWEVVLMKPPKKCCPLKVPDFIRVYVDSKTGAVIYKKLFTFRGQNKSDLSCFEPCH